MWNRQWRERLGELLAQHRFHGPARGGAPSLAGLVALAASGGCLHYDATDKCGAHMRYSEDTHVCLCDERSAPVAGGCEPCTEDREPRDGECVCRAGTRAGADGECEAVGGPGEPCDAVQVCEHPVYDFCAMPEGESSGTCTQRCASDEDCELIQRGAESGNLAQTLELAHGVSELYIGTSRLLERELRERRREPA